MATITAKDVNDLRQITGAGMMDCKKALEEAGGDREAAIDILRKKGQKISEKRSDRDANEGAIFAYGDHAAAALIELNCETDFVARNEDFQGLGRQIVEKAFGAKASDLEAVLALPLDSRAVADHLTDAMGRIGEKIAVRNYARAEGDRVITYIHPGARVGVIVAFNGVGSEDIESVGKDIAMQIAAMKPVSIDESGVPAEVVAREMNIAREKAAAEGKPENLLDRIAEGTVKKFYKDNTLLAQEFVKDSSKTVAQYLKEKNPKLTVASFRRLQLGDA
jgi:elongation factor Ts